MKLLPHVFKWIGLSLFFLGFIFNTIDEGRRDFMDGYNSASREPVEYVFNPIFPEVVMHISDITMLVGLLIYILAKNRREDEFAQKLRYESAFMVLVLTILVILIRYIFVPDFMIEPSTLISAQMIFYLIIRSIKKQVILAE
jgi:hypothetical protein